MNPDQVSRMDQAGAYIRELSGVIASCVQVLASTDLAYPLHPFEAATIARDLVVAAMEIGTYQEDV